MSKKLNEDNIHVWYWIFYVLRYCIFFILLWHIVCCIGSWFLPGTMSVATPTAWCKLSPQVTQCTLNDSHNVPPSQDIICLRSIKSHMSFDLLVFYTTELYFQTHFMSILLYFYIWSEIKNLFFQISHNVIFRVVCRDLFWVISCQKILQYDLWWPLKMARNG